MPHRSYLLGFIAAIIGGAVLLAYPTRAGAPPVVTSSFSVKVVLPNGHGSGTHIGEGYVVTAAHVVGDKKKVALKTDHGNQRYADVLWVNKEYDVALLRTNPVGLQAAHMSCRMLAKGDAIRAEGNPLNLEFVSTSGKISGEARELTPWKMAYVTDMTTVMGASGGGVFDEFNNMIGVTVGVAAAAVGPQGTPSLTGYGMVVPSSVVCMLMGRGV